jgi:inner membrane protease ATP23
MMHELIHAYDWCRVDFNPDNCLHIACTEIRAANLSGDCNLAMEVIRGRGWGFTKHKQSCVKRIAQISLEMNKNCEKNAKRSVELAWDLCWPDSAPFDHIP